MYGGWEGALYVAIMMKVMPRRQGPEVALNILQSEDG